MRGGGLNTWGFGRLARLCSPSSSNNNLDFIKCALGVDRGEVSAHAVFGEDKTSNRRIARIGLVGGEKDKVGESGSNPPHVWNKIQISYVFLNGTVQPILTRFRRSLSGLNCFQPVIHGFRKNYESLFYNFNVAIASA